MKKQKASLSVRVKKAWKRDKMLILMSLLPMAMIIVFKYFPMFGIVMLLSGIHQGKDTSIVNL